MTLSTDDFLTLSTDVDRAEGATVTHIKFNARIQQEISYLSPQQAVKYQEGESPLAHLVSFEKHVGDRIISIDVSKVAENIVTTIKASPDATAHVENSDKK